jgi:hypothetical protein
MPERNATMASRSARGVLAALALCCSLALASFARAEEGDDPGAVGNGARPSPALEAALKGPRPPGARRGPRLVPTVRVPQVDMVARSARIAEQLVPRRGDGRIVAVVAGENLTSGELRLRALYLQTRSPGLGGRQADLQALRASVAEKALHAEALRRGIRVPDAEAERVRAHQQAQCQRSAHCREVARLWSRAAGGGPASVESYRRPLVVARLLGEVLATQPAGGRSAGAQPSPPVAQDRLQAWTTALLDRTPIRWLDGAARSAFAAARALRPVTLEATNQRAVVRKLEDGAGPGAAPPR